MTNKEKYGKEILDIACTGDRVAMRNSDNVIVGCRKLECLDCAFNTHGKGCNYAIEKWANSEYIEPPVDWSKVAVDTPILVRDSEEQAWRKRYFAKYDNGIVFAWENGATSWGAHRSNITDWGMAKLAESEEKIIECMRNEACEHMTLDEQISFCDEKSKNIKLKAEPQTFVDIKNSLEKLKNPWIPVSERLPECCGYPVLLTVENKFNQRFVCKAFTNYMKEGNPLFYTNEKEYCKELTSSKLSNAWKPIAWMPLPEPYRESEG